MPKVNYAVIDSAEKFYQGRGYVLTDVPWLVRSDAYMATKPVDALDLYVASWNKYLVASGEQSFIHMMLDGRQFKRAMCITPCFRDDKEDDIHHKTFTKLELIKADEVSVPHLFSVIHDAMSFFETYGLELKIVETGQLSFDIQVKKSRLELGSYGIREYKNLKWIYGTGVAEPRLSNAVEMQ